MLKIQNYSRFIFSIVNAFIINDYFKMLITIYNVKTLWQNELNN